VLKNKFKEKFRRRPKWSVDWSKEPDFAANAAPANARTVNDAD